MKAAKLSFDFSDHIEVVEQLRLLAATRGLSMKVIVLKALEAYFANTSENQLLLRAAEKSFSEWDNPHDKVYDSF
jgi:hypothetical protein